MDGNGLRQAIHITLRGRFNITYSGTLILHGNVSSRLAPVDDVSYNRTHNEDKYDATGASYYVIAVVLVYGMSIVALIASHINRRHNKITEDKQIDKYLQDFQIIKEVHARDNYKNLKKSVMNKINWDRKKGTHRTLQKSILPLLAIGMQVGASRNNSTESIYDGPHKGKSKVYPIGTKRHSDPDLSDSMKLIEVSEPRPARGRRHSYMDHPYNPGSCNSQDAGHSFTLLTIPDRHPSGLHIGAPSTGASATSGTTDSASARRLRFSASVTSVSHLDRSLNSIAEGEEGEEKDNTPPTTRGPPTPQSSLDSQPPPTPVVIISKEKKLRRIGVSLSPPPDIFFQDVAHDYTSVPVRRRSEEHVVNVHVDDMWTSRDLTDSPTLKEEDEDFIEEEDLEQLEEPDPALMSPPQSPLTSPVTSPLTSHPVSIMVEDEDEDIQAAVDEDEYRLTPQTLLASIKFTGGTLSPNTSPHRSRSSSITSILSRRGSKDRRRSAGSGGREFEGLVEVIDDNPLQITCL